MEAPVEHDVHALAGTDQRRRRRVVEPPQRVGPGAGGVDHHLRAQHPVLAALDVARLDAAHDAVLLHQPGHRHVVEHRRAEIRRRHRQTDGESRVVELAVVVEDAAAQSLGLDRRQPLERLRFGEEPRRAEAFLARQQVVEAESDAVKRRLPPVVAGHHERNVVHQVRRVAAQDAALTQRLEHQRDVALAQVADAAVNQLGGAARGALGEVALLEQQRAIAARGGVDRDAEAGRAAADDDEIPRIALAVETREGGGAIHRWMS